MYLGDYNDMKDSVALWESERNGIETELSSVPVAISKYGGEPVGGSGELNVVEQQAQERIELEERLAEIDRDVKRVRALMRKIEDAVASFDPETCNLIWDHYVERRRWYDIASAMYLSETSVKQRGYRAIQQLSQLLFGLKAHPYEQVALIQ